MKRLVFLFLFLPSITYSQHVFIGLTREEVRNYWELHVSNEYFMEGKYDDSGKDYFMIMLDDVGIPDFSANFNEDGICYEHQLKLGYSDISVKQARLKHAGYSYNEEKKGWLKEGENHIWTITQSGSDFLMTCEIL